ncbi:MAG: hypothetical protein ABW201_03650 [Candidatus Thiodiazotropha sp.]
MQQILTVTDEAPLNRCLGNPAGFFHPFAFPADSYRSPQRQSWLTTKNLYSLTGLEI